MQTDERTYTQTYVGSNTYAVMYEIPSKYPKWITISEIDQIL